jgi:hypothetical protein
MKIDYQINDMCTIKSNVIFKTIIQRNTSRGHSRAVISYACLGLVQSQVATQYASLPIHSKKTVSSHIRSQRFTVHIVVTNWIKQLKLYTVFTISECSLSCYIQTAVYTDVDKTAIGTNKTRNRVKETPVFTIRKSAYTTSHEPLFYSMCNNFWLKVCTYIVIKKNIIQIK